MRVSLVAGRKGATRTHILTHSRCLISSSACRPTMASSS